MTQNLIKPSASDFVSWAVGHAKKTSMAVGGYLEGNAGVAPWVYLYGTNGTPVTDLLLALKFKTYYAKHGWTREQYDAITANWPEEKKIATDCEGLYDAWAGIDVNADYNYRHFCTEKGLISEIDRPYVIGEAVFNGTAKKKTHVGWVCGFTKTGIPLVVEARGLAYGVVITNMKSREWKYRGLMTEKLNYADSKVQPGVIDFVFRRTLKAGMKGADVTDLKKLLVAHGYSAGITVDGKSSGTYGASTRKVVKAFQMDAGLTIDGKAGKKTIRALGGIYA